MTGGLSHQICTVLFFMPGHSLPLAARGPCLAPCCPADITPCIVCSCQMDKREHMYLPGLWFFLACSLCYPPLTFWTLSAFLFKDSKTRACGDRWLFSQWQFFSFFYCLALRLLCWTGSVWHLSVTMPSSCVSRQILSELDTLGSGRDVKGHS